MPSAIHVGAIVDPLVGRLEDQVIEIEDGVITAVTPRAGWSGGTDLLDASDLVVVPGFVDCHDHLTISMGDEQEQAARPLARQAVTAAQTAREVLNAGITTVRTLGDSAGIDLQVRRAVESGLIPGPRILPAAKPIMRTGGHAHFFGREADGPDDVRAAVREQIRAGAAWIKVMASGGNSTPGSDPQVQEFSDEELRAVGEECARAGIDVTAHFHGGPALDTVIAAGFRSIEHGAFLTDEQLDTVASSGLWLVSTVGVGRAVANDEQAPAFYRAKAQKAAAKRVDMLRKARAKGVLIAVGCDTNHGGIQDEAQALADAGFTGLEALAAITIQGARLCRIDHLVGSIETGKRADLVLLAGDPTQDISAYGRVRGVFREGVRVTAA